MRYLSAALIVLFILAVALFMAQNPELAMVSFASLHLRLPLWLLVMVVYALGMLTGGMLWSLLQRALRRVSATG